MLNSGEFVVVNKHLLHDLTDMGLWSPALKNEVIYHNGSVQNIREIPEELKAIYRYRLKIVCDYCLKLTLFMFWHDESDKKFF